MIVGILDSRYLDVCVLVDHPGANVMTKKDLLKGDRDASVGNLDLGTDVEILHRGLHERFVGGGPYTFLLADAGASRRALQDVAEMSHILHICALFQVSGTLHNPACFDACKNRRLGVPCEVSLSAAS
jgi:hypothetical protein